MAAPDRGSSAATSWVGPCELVHGPRTGRTDIPWWHFLLSSPWMASGPAPALRGRAVRRSVRGARLRWSAFRSWGLSLHEQARTQNKGDRNSFHNDRLYEMAESFGVGEDKKG